MTSTSAALRDIEGAAEFSTVTVRLPPSWNTATSGMYLNDNSPIIISLEVTNAWIHVLVK